MRVNLSKPNNKRMPSGDGDRRRLEREALPAVAVRCACGQTRPHVSWMRTGANEEHESAHTQRFQPA